jgi:hypothetical protein
VWGEFLFAHANHKIPELSLQAAIEQGIDFAGAPGALSHPAHPKNSAESEAEFASWMARCCPLPAIGVKRIGKLPERGCLRYWWLGRESPCRGPGRIVGSETWRHVYTRG